MLALAYTVVAGPMAVLVCLGAVLWLRDRRARGIVACAAGLFALPAAVLLYHHAGTLFDPNGAQTLRYQGHLTMVGVLVATAVVYQASRRRSG